jgi:hypothetical protein
MYCFKFPSREEFLNLAAAEGLVDADGTPAKPAKPKKP